MWKVREEAGKKGERENENVRGREKREKGEKRRNSLEKEKRSHTSSHRERCCSIPIPSNILSPSVKGRRQASRKIPGPLR